MAPMLSETENACIRETLSYFVRGVTGGRDIDEDALTVTNIDKLRATVTSQLKSTSLGDHMDLINSKNQLNYSCYVAADFANAQGFDYQVVHAMLTIFFFHAEDILEDKPDVMHNLQLKLATGEPLGDPVLDWYAREVTPLLWKHFHPLVSNMIIVACYDFVNGIGVEQLVRDAPVHDQAPQFPEWLRFKTGLSPMYALLALARHSDVTLKPSGGFEKYVQTVPDVVVFTNIVNDVISFYKELLAGEKGNYIDMRAEKDGVDVITAQRKLADEGIAVYNRVVATLADEPEYRANFEAYARGITHFHTSSPRYRLRELFGSNT
ncbi:Uu.00g146810.m01.CDS01 [Anthostomella pinea]|uniref:Uu.00g146810.m01.CDS01 n=1 Tax=Anthostomella pinea TaxID=933095 RepID=A0AAI8VKT3_9PEZI|nr:Uu.00g146810.m01.CDS01 [Anthostomella pinea]